MVEIEAGSSTLVSWVGDECLAVMSLNLWGQLVCLQRGRSANTYSHGTQGPGHLGCSLQTSLLHAAHYWTRSYLQCPQSTGYSCAFKPLLTLLPLPKIPLHPGRAKSPNSRPFTSPQEMRVATAPGTQQKPLSAASPPRNAVRATDTPEPTTAFIVTAAYETNSFLCFYSSLSLDTYPEGANIPLIQGW